MHELTRRIRRCSLELATQFVRSRAFAGALELIMSVTRVSFVWLTELRARALSRSHLSRAQLPFQAESPPPQKTMRLQSAD